MFTVAPLEDGSGYLMYDTFPEKFINGSVQQFWITNSSNLYCGALRDFFTVNPKTPATVRAPTTLVSGSTDRQLKYCSDVNETGTPDCSDLEWNMQLAPNNSMMEFHILLSSPVTHAHMVLHRTRTADQVPPVALSDVHDCNLTRSDVVNLQEQRQKLSKRQRRLGAPSEDDTTTSAATAGLCPFIEYSSTVHENDGGAEIDEDDYMKNNFTHCYVINRKHNVRLAWDYIHGTLLTHAQVRVRLSAQTTTDTSYVAIGFGQNHFPGMNGSDIALAFTTEVLI